MSNFQYSTGLFGLPYYIGKIEKDSYDKNQIIKDITENYNISSERNKWDNSWDKMSNLHHSYGDNDNPIFKKIDYSSLIPLYKKHIENFFNVYMNTFIGYRFDIENYTCMSKGQHMREHDHPQCEFSAVHYMKFNKEVHEPTVYINPSNFAPYFERIVSNKMVDVSRNGNLDYSWTRTHFKFCVEEDDFVITPAPLRHCVPVSQSEELRIAIVSNIFVND